MEADINNALVYTALANVLLNRKEIAPHVIVPVDILEDVRPCAFAVVGAFADVELSDA